VETQKEDPPPLKTIFNQQTRTIMGDPQRSKDIGLPVLQSEQPYRGCTRMDSDCLLISLPRKEALTGSQNVGGEKEKKVGRRITT